MSLKTRLSEISDPGQFENLATEILRWSDNKYKSVIQTGVNQEGKPIRDPVDGFGQVPDSKPPHYVILEFTTTQKSGLERKWLADPSSESDQPKGDLIKAAEKANDIRNDVTDAEFTVALICNRGLDSGFLEDIHDAANKLDVSVDIWDVNRLCNFLQTNPDGQYLRKKYFGIDEERLSEPLLMELSDKSLKSYREAFHIGTEEAKIERPELSKILERARSSSLGSYFIPIVGNSGFGKTVICHQAMEKWREDDRPTLRLDADDIETTKSLAHAIQSGLTRLQPSLESKAGRTSLQLAQDDLQLLLVVDDLNRADNPSRLLSKLQNWMGGAREDASNELDENESTKSDGLPITILCPLWPRVWANEQRNLTQNDFAEIIELDSLSAELSSQLIQSHANTHGQDIDEGNALRLAENVGRDPHLIGLLGQLMQTDEMIEDLPKTSKDVLGEYTEFAYETASRASNEPLVVPDYERAVEELSLDILEARDVEPNWRQIYEWSNAGSDYLDEIRILSEQEQLITILKQHPERILSFRHDRIRDYLLADASFKEINRTDTIPSCVNDPYYYSILGTGIAFFRPPIDVLSEVCDQNPLSLLEALRRLGGDAPDYEEKVGAEFQDWLESKGGYTEIPDSLLSETMDLLRQTYSNQVLEISELLPQFPPVLLARFLNGNLGAGIQYCKGNKGGSPQMNNPLRDSIFDDIMEQRGDQYTAVLSEALPSVEDENVEGVLRLAGFFGRTELGPGLKECWELHGDNQELLPAFLWATFQCCIPEHQSLVNQVIGQWESLPSGNSIDDTDIEFGSGDVYRVINNSLSRPFSDGQVEYLIEAVEKFPDIEHYFVSLLSRVSDPDSLELVVKKRGENIQDIDGMSPWATTLLDNWSPNRLRGESLPSESKERMEKIWSDDENFDEMRTSAFQLWSRNTEEDDLEDLKKASENELFEYAAHFHRLKLGDETAILSPKLDFVEYSGLLEALPNSWSPKAFELIDDLLSENSHQESDSLFYSLGRVLFRIPRSDAEQLLETHWEKVGTHPKFFQAALYCATSRTEELAEEAYNEFDNTSALLNHLGMEFGFKTSGRSQLISERHLIALQPYLSDISDLDLTDIAEKAHELGMEDWAANHVQHHLPKDRRQEYFPTDDDLIAELDEIEMSEERDIKGWMIRIDRRYVSKLRVFEVLQEWLRTDPSVEAYRMSVELVKNWGTRKELELLDEISIEDESVTRLYKDAEFGVKVRTLN